MVQTIEGRPTLVVKRTPPLPPSLDRLLAALSPVTFRADIRPAGARVACETLREHRFARLREGRHVGLDAVIRDLRVLMCQDCGAVQVRDVSIDTLPGLRAGRAGPARRDMVIGWYSGARRNQREYK